MDLPLRVPPSSYSALARDGWPFINRRASSQKKVRRASANNMTIVKEMDFCYLSKQKSSFPRTEIKSSADAYEVIKAFYHDDLEIYESFFILLIDRSNHTIGYAKISQGGVASTVVDTKILTKYVVDSMATAVVLAHNHPSGNLQPSSTDIALTKQLKICVGYFSTTILDHIILTSSGYYSFADEGIL
jgi:DNA repair protein RadC